jgi:hypothetical protein
MKSKPLIIILLIVVLTLTSCIPGDGKANTSHSANMLVGIWHGWIAPVSLIISIFREHLHIYEPYNTGFWYDLGFYMGIIGGFGSLSLSRNKRKERG